MTNEEMWFSYVNGLEQDLANSRKHLKNAGDNLPKNILRDEFLVKEIEGAFQLWWISYKKLPEQVARELYLLKEYK